MLNIHLCDVIILILNPVPSDDMLLGLKMTEYSYVCTYLYIRDDDDDDDEDGGGGDDDACHICIVVYCMMLTIRIMTCEQYFGNWVLLMKPTITFHKDECRHCCCCCCCCCCC